MGAQETIPLVASYLGSALVPSIYVAKGIEYAYLTGFGICVVCFLLVLVVGALDKATNENDQTYI